MSEPGFAWIGGTGPDRPLPRTPVEGDTAYVRAHEDAPDGRPVYEPLTITSVSPDGQSVRGVTVTGRQVVMFSRGLPYTIEDAIRQDIAHWKANVEYHRRRMEQPQAQVESLEALLAEIETGRSAQ